MNIRQIEYVKELAKTHSFLKASENLYVTQPTISKQIKVLEEELGVILFDRTSKSVIPTSACLEFLKHGEAIINETNKLIESMQKYSHTKEKVKIAVIYSLTFFDFLNPLKNYIETSDKYDISLYTDTSITIRKNLLNNKIDLGITIINKEIPGIKVVKKLVNVYLAATLKKDHPLTKYDELSVKQLRKYPLIIMSKDSIMYKDTYNLIKDTCNICCTCPAFDTACELTKADVGIGLVGISENKINQEYNGLVFRKIKTQANVYSLACIVNGKNDDDCIKTIINSVY